MIAQHRCLIADAGQDALAPAGEAREEVGFDEPLRYEQVGVHRRPVDDQGRAGGQDADLDVGIRVKGIVNDDFLGTRNFLPQLGFQLGGGGEPVETGGYQQRHLNFRIALAQLRQHGGQDIPAGYRAGVVGNDDGAAFLPRRESGQGGRSHGQRHGFLHQLPTGAVAFQLVHPGGQQTVIGECNIQMAFAVRNRDHKESSHRFVIGNRRPVLCPFFSSCP